MRVEEPGALVPLAQQTDGAFVLRRASSLPGFNDCCLRPSNTERVAAMHRASPDRPKLHLSPATPDAPSASARRTRSVYFTPLASRPHNAAGSGAVLDRVSNIVRSLPGADPATSHPAAEIRASTGFRAA